AAHPTIGPFLFGAPGSSERLHREDTCLEGYTRQIGLTMVGAPVFPIRGRAHPLETIRKRLNGVRAGVGAVILIEGRAGEGKSRLLQACASMAAAPLFRTPVWVCAT